MKDGIYILPYAVKDGKAYPLMDTLVSVEDVLREINEATIDVFISCIDPIKNKETNT